MTAAFDPTYRDAFASKLVAAMFDVSVQDVDGQSVCILRSAELIEAMLTHIAFLSRDSEVTTSPARTREFCDNFARKLQRRIAQAKQTATPFETLKPDRTN